MCRAFLCWRLAWLRCWWPSETAGLQKHVELLFYANHSSKHGPQPLLHHLLLVQRKCWGCWWHILTVAVAAAAAAAADLADLARGVSVSVFICTCGCCSGARRRQRKRRQIIILSAPQDSEPREVTWCAQIVFFRLCVFSLVEITPAWGIFIFCACPASDRILAAVAVLEASIAVAINLFFLFSMLLGRGPLWTGLGPRRGAGVALRKDEAVPAVLER